MKILVEAVTKAQRSTPKGMCWGVKVGDKWLDYFDPTPPRKGSTIEVEVSETNPKWVRPMEGRVSAPPQLQEPSKPAPTLQERANNGGIQWFEYVGAMRIAHAVAKDLEPDVEGGIPDRSQARAALVDTLMIALTAGRVELPKEGFEEADKDGTPF